MKVYLGVKTHRQSHTQSGMVLLLCLIFLTALTLLILSASANSILQNQLSTNLREAERAKQTALAAQSWAEQWLLGLDGPAPGVCMESCEGLKLHGKDTLPPYPEFESLSWWMARGHEAGLDPVSGIRMATIGYDSINTPVWIVQAMHEVPASEDGQSNLQTWYRILTRGSGRAETSVSVVESTISRSWASSQSSVSTETDLTDRCPGTKPGTECGRVSWRELR
jgi:Tfp pilus assembly protein PilX